MKILVKFMAVAAVGMFIPAVGAATTASASGPTITVSVTPNPLVETGSSDVNAVVQVESLPSLAGTSVNISSIQLQNTCAAVYFYSIASGTLRSGNPITVKLDNEGNATVLLSGTECDPGNQVIEADLATTPYWSATTKLHVEAPKDTTRGVFADPRTEVETGTSGEGGNSDVYAVFYAETYSVYAESKVEIEASELVDRCGGGSWWYTNVGSYHDSLTATAVLDDNGNAVFDFVGISCAAGTSTIIADVESGLHPTYTNKFTVQSPRRTIAN
jgi:hypothetical protein